MMRWLVLLMLCGCAYGAIVPKYNVSCNNPTVTCTNSITVSPNDTVVVVGSTNSGTPAPGYTFTSDCGLAWTATGNDSNVIVTYAVAVQTSVSGLCNITGTRSSGNNTSWVAQSYSGVASVGTPNLASDPGQCSIAAGYCQITMSIANPGDTMLNVTYLTGGTNQFVNITGATNGATLRVWTQSVNGTVALADITSPTAPVNVSPRITFTMTTNSTPRGIGLMLIATTGTAGRVALASDQMHTVTIGTAASSTYTLPNTTLTTNQDWCAWIMPIGSVSNTYQIVPDSGVSINGQTSPITQPSWQMTRACQDTSNNYWIDPPLVAGSGITITPTATAVTIASTGSPAGGSPTKIAGGTSYQLAVPSGGFAANTCVLIPSGGIPAPGTVTTDTVVYSRQSSPSGWGNGNLIIHPEPFTGTISFEVCNNSSGTLTPSSALPVNWMVLR